MKHGRLALAVEGHLAAMIQGESSNQVQFTARIVVLQGGKGESASVGLQAVADAVSSHIDPGLIGAAGKQEDNSCHASDSCGRCVLNSANMPSHTSHHARPH